MGWMWWTGAGIALMCGVACGINLGMRVARGQARVWEPQVLAWAVGFHGAAGVAALMMIVAAKG